MDHDCTFQTEISEYDVKPTNKGRERVLLTFSQSSGELYTVVVRMSVNRLEQGRGGHCQSALLDSGGAFPFVLLDDLH